MANDIYVYFDSQGTLKERLSSPVRSFGSGNRLLAHLEGDADGSGYASVNVKFRRLGTNEWAGELTHTENKYIPTDVIDPRYFSKTKRYRFNVVKIPSYVLDETGTWEARFEYKQSDDEIYPSGTVTFQVEGREPTIGSKITIDQYNELLEGAVSKEYVDGTFVTKEDFELHELYAEDTYTKKEYAEETYAKKDWVDENYVSESELEEYKQTVDSTYAKKSELADYATESWVEGKGYITSDEAYGAFALKGEGKTYYAGEGIHISADNVISATMSFEYIEDVINQLYTADGKKFLTHDNYNFIVS